MRYLKWLMIIVFLFLSSEKVHCFSNMINKGGHDSITQHAANFALSLHLEDRKFSLWLTDERTGALNNFITGAHDEDCTLYNAKVPLSDLPIGPNCESVLLNCEWGNFFEHFYNPLTGQGFYSLKAGGSRPAPFRADDYERAIKKLICSSGRYSELSDKNRSKVNDYFGRALHLIQDMGMSYHTKVESHIIEKPLEMYVQDNWGEIAGSSYFQGAVSVQGYGQTNYSPGRCIDPTVAMRKLALWSNVFPADRDYYDVCRNDPPRGLICQLNQEKLSQNATLMSAEATLFTTGYIDQIWRAINSDCICDPPVSGVGRGQPDDTFSVNGSFLGTTQLELSAFDRLNFFLRLALKKGDISPLYTKQLMDVYAEAKALPPTATQETKDEIQARFQALLATLNNLPVRDQDEWPDIALLENGYHDEALSLINKANEPVRYIHGDADPSTLRLNPILVIPSGGLIGREKSDLSRAFLDEYVRSGGTLIVFAQPYGYLFSVLPVPEEQDGTLRYINGFGWEEDQNCFADAVYLDGWHQMFAGQSRSTPTMNVDGYFTVYPSSTSVLLRRTANGQPAMLTYSHGQGRVIVTSMYSDFASGQLQASAEERALIRDMIAWTKKPTQLPEIRRGEAISITLDVVNHTDIDAASAKLLIYNPERSRLMLEQTISGLVPAHGSTQVAIQYAAAADAYRGIYHVDYMLLDSQGVMLQPQTETDAGRFVVSEPPGNPYKNPDFNFSATTNIELVPIGSDVVFTVHGWNNTQQQRTVTARYVFPHMYWITQDVSYGVFTGSYEPGKDTGWLTKTLTIGPSGKTSFDHIMRNAQHDEFIYINFYDENNKLIGRMQRGFFLFHPSARVTVSSNKSAYLPGETISVNTEFTNLALTGFSAIARIRLLDGSGATLFEEERSAVIPPYGTSRVDAMFFLPLNASRGKYTVNATLATGSVEIASASMSVDVESKSSRVNVVPSLPRPLRAGLNTVSFTVTNSWLLPINNGIIEINLQDPHGSSIFQNSYPFTLSPGETKVIDTSMTLSELSFGNYALNYAQSDETRTGSFIRIDIPIEAIVSLSPDKSTYRAGETLIVTAELFNNGKFEFNNVECVVTIPELGLSQNQFVTVPVGKRVILPVSFQLPNNIASGHYMIKGAVVLPSGDRVTSERRFNIPQSSLIMTIPGPRAVTSGSLIHLLVENDGGADTQYTGRIFIRDGHGITIYESNVNGVIRVGERKALADVVIPSQTAQGKHILTVILQDLVAGSNPSLNVALDITGTSASLHAQSSKEVYASAESIVALSDIVNGPFPIVSGNLRVIVKTFAGQSGFTHFLPKTGWIEVSPQAVTVSSDGSVYIAEAYRILHFDALWNLVDEWGTCGSDTGQLNGVTGLAAGLDGSVYVADSGNHRVQRFTSYGAFLQAWGGRGYNDGQFLSPDGLAVGPDGAVYVSDSGNNRIQKFSSNGAFLTKWGFSGIGDGLFHAPAGIATGPDGSVYVADSGNHRIQRFTSDGIFMTKWGSEGTGDEQLSRPQAVTVGLDGSVYVGNNDRIQRFTADGAFVSSGGSSGMSATQFLEIASMAAGPDGTIYAADTINYDIQRFDSSLGFISHWGSHGSQNGWFYHPSCLAFSPEGHLFVADSDNHRIQKFTYGGDFIASWGSEGSGDGEFFRPVGVAVNPEGSVFIADYYNHRVQKFDNEGRFVMTWGGEGSEDGKFSYPDGIAVNSQGEVYVADRVNNRIQKFNSNGIFITKWSTGMPEGIAVGFGESVYVLDYVYGAGWSKRIQKFNANGDYLHEWEWWSTGYSGGIAADEQGFVYLSDGTFIYKFDSNGNYVEQWEGLGECTGLTVGANGAVFCADTNASRIFKYQPGGPKTVFERNIPLTLNPQESRQEITSIGTLDEQGKYFLHATHTNSLGQKIAQSEYPFYVTKGNLALRFSTDKAVYTPGEVVTIRGEAQNLTSAAAQEVAFVMNQQGLDESQTLYTATFDLGANSTYPFTVTTHARPDGVYVITGRLTHTNTTVFEGNDRYESATPNVSMYLMSPDMVGADNFAISLEVKNEGKRDVTVTLTSPFDTQVLTIAVGTSHTLAYPNQQITEDTTYRFVLSGEINQTVSKTVVYGLSSALAINASPMYLEGAAVIPISIDNTGIMDSNLSVDISLEPSGLISRKTYFIPQGHRISDTLLFDLIEGDYTVTLTSQAPLASTSASFSVRKEDKVTMAPIVIGVISGGFIPVSTVVANQGYRNVEGAIQLSISNTQGVIVWQSSQAMTLPASEPMKPVLISLNFPTALLQSGSYTVKIAFLNGGQQELASQTAPLILTGASLRLTQIPSSQTITAGEEAIFAFGVTNAGGKEASAELTLKSNDFINLTRRVLINPGEVKDILFAFPIPSDLEEKDYYAEYELKGENGAIAKGQVKYHIAGIHISVATSLNKDHYREGETARLAMIINQQSGGGSRNLFARVNYAGYDGKQSFSLSGSQNLSFDIPLTAITGEKLFYGIYDEGGRSIHLNSLYINKTGDAFTIITNKQVYNQGETVSMTIAGSSSGMLTISGPGGYSETFSFGGSATKSFVLPQIARAGTYYIEASLVTAEGQTLSMSKPIDIAGIAVKVKEAVLDKGKYLPGDTLQLSMRIESNVDMTSAILKVWSIDPEKNSSLIGERPLSLTRAEQAILSSDFPTTITSSGIHKVVYGIYLDQLLLSAGNVSFDAGDGVILGIATDRDNYPLGSEAVVVRLNLYGRSDATLTLNVNGATVHSESISLNGFTPMTIQLPVPGPGIHTLEGTLAAGGLSSKKETKFLYGSNLTDLAADVWGSGMAIGKDGTLKLIATAGNRGRTVALPTSMTLNDGNTLLTTFSVGELAAGASQSYEYLWNVLGKAGEHTLAATIDPGNSVIEFIKENNRVTRRIMIPDIALITETGRDNYRLGEQVAINATIINLTAGTNYPNLTCTTIVRDAAGVEVHRQADPFSLAHSQSAITTAMWNTAGLSTEGRYAIRQEVTSGMTLLAEKTKNITITAGTGFGLIVDPALLRIKQGETAVFTVSVNFFQGWSGTVTLNAEGILSGAAASLAPSAVSGTGTSVLSITTNGVTPTGTYLITVRAQGNDGSGIISQTIPVTLEVSGFSFQASPASISVTQQETAEFVVNVQSLNSYAGNITLSHATGSIGGLILTIANPNLAVPGEAVIRVQTSKYVPPGTYAIKLSGSDSIISKDVNLEVVVCENADIIPGFVLTPGPGYDNRALVTLMNRNFVEKVEFNAFNTRFGANAVMGDIDGDGEDEIIVAPGPDPLADGRIRVFRKNATLILEQPVFTTKFGATLAAGDIDGDWREEVVVGAGPGLRNTSRVKVLSFDGQRLADTGIDFVAFPDSYKLGVKVALGDVDGDGILEIIAGAGPNPLSPSRIKVFKIDTTGGVGLWRVASTLSDFVVNFGDWYPYLFGVNVAAGDVDGDGVDEIIAGAGPNPLQKAIVAVYKGDGTFTGTRFQAYPANEYRFGVNVAARDLDGDGVAEIITGPGPSPFSESWVRVFKGDGTLLWDGFLAFPETRRFGVKVTTGNVGE